MEMPGLEKGTKEMLGSEREDQKICQELKDGTKEMLGAGRWGVFRKSQEPEEGTKEMLGSGLVDQGDARCWQGDQRDDMSCKSRPRRC
jgi:hypothetical protein